MDAKSGAYLSSIVLNLQTQACLAGDSAAYERRASNLDDVVIISALRTPMCKVQSFLKNSAPVGSADLQSS